MQELNLRLIYKSLDITDGKLGIVITSDCNEYYQQESSKSNYLWSVDVTDITLYSTVI